MKMGLFGISKELEIRVYMLGHVQVSTQYKVKRTVLQMGKDPGRV